MVMVTFNIKSSNEGKKIFQFLGTNKIKSIAMNSYNNKKRKLEILITYDDNNWCNNSLLMK